MPDLASLHKKARAIVEYTLSSVDPAAAMRKAIELSDGKLTVPGIRFEVSRSPIYVIGLGKAAAAMAQGLEQALGELITAGIIVDPLASHSISSPRWQTFSGGHPLPNDESLRAAQAAFALLNKANTAESIVIFLVSGGGSAMLEWPARADISLEDLRMANQILVTCGASITEINAVRREFSAVKGGKLAQHAANARVVTMIVSDTNPGDEASVASGPTLLPSPTSPVALDVVRKHRLESTLPRSVVNCLELNESKSSTAKYDDHPYYVILSNQSAIAAAARKASELGFVIDIADEISEEDVGSGSRLLLKQLEDAAHTKSCIVSGGEFSCPVRGEGRGGRNLETALRCALMMDGRSVGGPAIAVSFGTDGIDGNTTAAGAIADATTMDRGRKLGLDGRRFLECSDSYGFFERVGDLIVTGPSGTNVRDVRILLRDDDTVALRT